MVSIPSLVGGRNDVPQVPVGIRFAYIFVKPSYNIVERQTSTQTDGRFGNDIHGRAGPPTFGGR